MDTIGGLPAHVLIIHFVVVAVPLAALLTVLSAVWPAARRKLGIITPIVALAALGSVPVATHAGEWLEVRVYSSDLVRRHTSLGDELLPWVIGLAAVAILAWLLPFLVGRGRTQLDALWIRLVVGVLAIGLAGVSVLQVYRIGDSGARAAWTGAVCTVPYENGQCPGNDFLK